MFPSRRFHLTCVPPADVQVNVEPYTRMIVSPLKAQRPYVNELLWTVWYEEHTHYWLFGCSEIPRPQPRVNTCTHNYIWVIGMPVDVSDCSIVGPEDMFNRSFAGKIEVPNEPAIIFRWTFVWIWQRKSDAHSFSLEVETIYSLLERCGFHCTSATSHVPPWGKNLCTSSVSAKRIWKQTNLGTLRGASKSMMNSPFRLECVKEIAFYENQEPTQQAPHHDSQDLCSS